MTKPMDQAMDFSGSVDPAMMRGAGREARKEKARSPCLPPLARFIIGFLLIRLPPQQVFEEPEITPGLKIMKKEDKGGGADQQTGEKRPGSITSAAQDQQQGASGKKAVVGDGGLSWRLKALARAKAQAGEGGASLAAVVSERWGSLSSLTSTLPEGRAADSESKGSARTDAMRYDAPAAFLRHRLTLNFPFLAS